MYFQIQVLTTHSLCVQIINDTQKQGKEGRRVCKFHVYMRHLSNAKENDRNIGAAYDLHLHKANYTEVGQRSLAKCKIMF